MYLFPLFFILSITSLYAQDIVINELHNAPCKGSHCAEFIELYNTSSKVIDLEDWQIKGGVRYRFPKFKLAPQAYCIISNTPQKLGDSTHILGPFEGSLSQEKELIKLYNAQGAVEDVVHYEGRFPWPITGGGSRYSLQLKSPLEDNAQAGNWSVAKATPLAANDSTVLSTQKNILVQELKHGEDILSSNATQLIELTLAKANEVAIDSAVLYYQQVAPGNYIAQSDSLFLLDWKTVPMQKTENGYAYTFPEAMHKHRHLMRYRVELFAKQQRLALPYETDPSYNYAYFCYDGLSDYEGYSFEELPPVEVCHIIAKKEELDLAFFKYKGRDYPHTATVVYGGKVYDHVGYRSRGYKNRHQRKKRNLKLNFNRGNPVKVHKDEGGTYAVKRDKLVLSGGWLLDYPSSHGLGESILYKMFTLQGGIAPYADYVHLRMIDEAVENDSTANDFFGIYLILENFDGDFLETHNLPKGNIYSYKPFKMRYIAKEGPYERRNEEYTIWDYGFNKVQRKEWWEEQLDIDNFFAFLAGEMAVCNRESGYRKQHWWAEYKHPEKGWQFFPWDQDKTLKKHKGYGTIGSEIREKLFLHKEYRIAFENYLRSFVDLFYNEEQCGQLIREEAAYISNFEKQISFADLDRLRWHQPYEEEDSNFFAQIAYLERFVERRRKYIKKYILDGNKYRHPSDTSMLPVQAQIVYSGLENHPIDALSFTLEGGEGKSIQWRIAEVSSENRPNRYEIKALWEVTYPIGKEKQVNIPQQLLVAGRTYRVRARLGNEEGRYGYWSAPVEFVGGKPNDYILEGVKLTEVFLSDTLSYIAVVNEGKVAVDLKACRLRKGVKYKFEKSLILEPGEQIYLTNSQRMFKALKGVEAYAKVKFKGLKPGKEIILQDAYKQVLSSLTVEPTKAVVELTSSSSNWWIWLGLALVCLGGGLLWKKQQVA